MNNLNTVLTNIVEDYCSEYGVKSKDLFRQINKTHRTKKIKNTYLPVLRMTLGYYFNQEFGLPKTHTSKFVGYSSHSTLSHNEKKVKWFLDTNDLIFGSYYNKLKEVVAKYDSELESMKKVVLKP